MPHRGTLIIRKSAVAWPRALKCASAVLFMLLPAFARDNGQWENVDPVISGWIRGLMQPDNPLISCCGQADAYWADGVEIKEGQVIAIVTDTRPDIPLGPAYSGWHSHCRSAPQIEMGSWKSHWPYYYFSKLSCSRCALLRYRHRNLAKRQTRSLADTRPPIAMPTLSHNRTFKQKKRPPSHSGLFRSQSV